ncbi:hypothetical protein HN51_043584 [Arachis hypogaea]
MKLEARSLQANMKASLLIKLREYKTDLNNLKSEPKRITSAANNNNDELLELGQADTLAPQPLSTLLLTAGQSLHIHIPYLTISLPHNQHCNIS